MCGIAGYLRGNGTRLDRSLLRPMCDRIRHRGPDGYGEFFDGDVALGHRRLSIIDLSGGAQPLGNEDGSVQVVFNGEIYNFLEIRKDLVARGHQFRTQSDTEVLVHLYEEHGERMPECLNGMFAFAIWDARRQQLFLARDRFGEKPLYYSSSVPGLRFCFASELKALTSLPEFRKKVNHASVAQFLSHSYIADPETIYENVHRLNPGHSLTVSTGGDRIRQYWTPNFSVDGAADFNQSVERLRSLSADAVGMRMISDVALGAFLSGGVDSSAVVAHMASMAPDRVKTFSIGFTSEEFDELAYARMVVERYATEHNERIVTADVSEVLPTLVKHYDEPFGDSSAIPTLYLSRMTRQHVTVALSGDGADEIFGGYRRYRFGIVEERLRQLFPAWFRRTAIRIGAEWYPKLDYLPRIFRAKATLSCLSQELADAYYTSMTVFRDDGLARILSPDLRRKLGEYSTREVFRRRFESVRHLPPLQQMQAVDCQTYLAGDILTKVDRATMAYSLESRAPWLDHRLAEIAGSLPQPFKVHGETGKYVFKEAVRPLLPEISITRAKMGFAVPLASWFRTSLKPVFQSVVLGDHMEPYIALPEARRLFEEHQAKRRNRGSELWNLLMLGFWSLEHQRDLAHTPAETSLAALV